MGQGFFDLSVIRSCCHGPPRYQLFPQDPASLAAEMLKKRLDEAIQSNNTLKKENGELKAKVNFKLSANSVALSIEDGKCFELREIESRVLSLNRVHKY